MSFPTLKLRMTHQKDWELDLWIRRLQATGKAQSRYLWLTLIVGLFYLAIRLRDPAAASIKVPLFDFEFPARFVLASGGPVMAFLALASLGAIWAARVALGRIKDISPAIDGESLDEYPNVIDLAAYSMPRTPEILRHFLTVVSYPVFLALALVESAWLTYSVTSACILRPPWQSIFLIFTTGIWLRAVYFLVRMWFNRIRKLFLAVRDLLRKRS